MRIRHLIFAFAGLQALAGCVAVQPAPPLIERLPEGAAEMSAPAIATPLSLANVVAMARSGTPPNVIIQSLRDSRAAYAISAAQAGDLSRQGVPYEVIDYLRYGGRVPLAAYSYPAYAPYVFMPGYYYPTRGFGGYPRHRASGLHLRFGFRR